MRRNDAFGKLERCASKGETTNWLPLLDHLVDVAYCVERICRCNSVRRALTSAAQRELDGADLARLAVIALLHDIGKASSSFQSKRWAAGQRPGYWPNPSGHGAQAIYLFQDDEKVAHLLDALPVQEMVNWGAALIPLLYASFSHHGRPLLENQATLSQVSRKDWQPVTDHTSTLVYAPLPVLEAISGRARELFSAAFGSVERPLPNNPAFAHLFAGLVQFADWLGSDTRHFPIRIDADRGESAKQYADQAIAALGLDSTASRNHLLNTHPSFQQAFDVPAPHPIQAGMADDALGQLVILESETGSGKTEAALWRFIHLFQRGEVDSLYFALPTRVSAKQVYDRVRKAVDRLWAENRPLVLRALPGYSAADGEEPSMLPDFTVQWNDNPDDDEALRRWAAEAPKRFLAAPIAVGTIDQALLGILKVKHAHMRYALLARSLLVVDEVHASDAYMTALLEKLLKAHLGNAGHALLLSATLGSSARSRYLALEKPGVQPPRFSESGDTPYPAISDRHGLRAMVPTGRSKDVLWSLHDCIDAPEVVADLAIEAARTGAKVLVVRNTVAAATALFRAVECRPEASDWLFRVNDQPTLHHSRFSREDRPLLDAAIEEQLGKQRPPGARIIIGTQTLEQSLDIDADLLITDLCPMDVLLQRIGRLHRHQRDAGERPSAYASPKALVLTPAGHDLSSMLKRAAHGLGRFSDGGGVYPDLRIIEATRRLIDALTLIQIPAVNRRLVEGATHPDRLAIIEADMGEAWRRHGAQIAGDSGANRTIANLHILEIDEPFAEKPNQEFPTGEKVGTRLGTADRLVTFESPPAGPFGAPIKRLPIRAHLLPEGLPMEAEPEHIVTDRGITEFSLGNRRYRYSRLGLERIDE
ncbi:MAG: CRISPR-associated helicase Cas3' [Gammaproteobacteria bacterium]|nr:CRISPR-associated helicase Cas3' [Gammaproteobacteria bacterium]